MQLLLPSWGRVAAVAALLVVVLAHCGVSASMDLAGKPYEEHEDHVVKANSDAMSSKLNRKMGMGSCEPTPRDKLGPFFKDHGVPFFPNPMTAPYCTPTSGAPETYVPAPFVLKGVMRDQTTCRPINGSAVHMVLDIWQANEHGVYSNKTDNSTTWCRARQHIGEDGAYEIVTIMPGKYGNTTTCFRPRHVHLKVTAPGYRTLVTQVYFTGDINLGRKDCACTGCQSGNTALRVTPKNNAAQFNIVLQQDSY